MQQPIAIVGAGWSGLAAAIELIRAGRRVLLFEAAANPGGRARTLGVGGHTLDNGQHLFIGAYRQTLAMMARVGVDPLSVFERRRLDLHMTADDGHSSELRLSLPDAPIHAALAGALLTVRGVPIGHRLQAMLHGRKLFRAPATDTSVTQWLTSCGQPESLRRALWEPLCLAALNTTAATASARVFARVLADTFADRGGPDLLFPRRDLGSLFPFPALDWLQSRGTAIHLNTRVTALEGTGTTGRWRLHTGDRVHEVDGIILATDAVAASRLLIDQPGCGESVERLRRLGAEPIATIWLRFPVSGPVLSAPMQGRLDGPAQWIFDRDLTGHPGLIAAVISGRGPHMDMDRKALAAQVIEQLSDLVRKHGHPETLGVIREKRATHSCTPETESLRMPLMTGLPGVWLAGDHVANGLPATIEGAVINGRASARAVLETGRSGS